MGRKPSVSKSPIPIPVPVPVFDKAPMAENKSPSLERSEPLSGNSKPSVNRVDSQLENQNPSSPAPLYQNTSVQEVVLQDERILAQDKENGKTEVQEKSSTYRRRNSRSHASAVRRSQRIKTAALHHTSSEHDIEPYCEDITFFDNEKDEPDTLVDQVFSEPEPEANQGDKSVLEKVNDMLQRLEAFEKIIGSMQTKVDENVGLSETPSLSYTVYKSMYLDTQKKLEALTDENRELTGKLENALGKVEVLEKQSHVLVEILEKMKDVVLISSLTKSTEAAVNASNQVIRNRCADSAAKRKRHTQES